MSAGPLDCESSLRGDAALLPGERRQRFRRAELFPRLERAGFEVPRVRYRLRVPGAVAAFAARALRTRGVGLPAATG